MLFAQATVPPLSTTDAGESDASTTTTATTATTARRGKKGRARARAPAPKPLKPKALTPSAKICREFAGSDFTFITMSFLEDTREEKNKLPDNQYKVLDPYVYKLVPGNNAKKLIVNNIRPLLQAQINSAEGDGTRISTIVALKKNRHPMHLYPQRNPAVPVVKVKRRRRKRAHAVAFPEADAPPSN